MRNLSKSKLIAFRQCPRRLWLEIHRPELRDDSAATQASFSVGNSVGDIARQLYDPLEKGVLLDAQRDGFSAVFQRSQELLTADQPIFEAGYAIEGALAFADVMMPGEAEGKRVWHMIEVKSSTGVKDYHRDDTAIQAYIARKGGVPLASIALAHIDNEFVYPGGGDYRGLLKENDLTEEAFAREDEVRAWIAAAQEVAELPAEPEMATGDQCGTPFACGFYDYCTSREPQAEYPVYWLPRIQSPALRAHIEAHPALDLRDTPDNLLNDIQRRVKQCTLTDETYFDATGAAAALAGQSLPAYFLDFESIQFAVPQWAGTRPYQQLCFQFSLHILDADGKLTSQAFLDLSGDDPSRAFAEALVATCGATGPVYVYNAGFEGARIVELAERFSDLSAGLMSIKQRLFDLLPVTRTHYYHPSQQGSWSIKAVLPAVAPDLSYETLDGVQNGGMAMDAYLEAIHPDTPIERQVEIRQQLLAYCGLDTFAMVRLWQFLSGRADLKL